MDAESYRAASRERWERSAPGWGAQRESLRAATAPVTAWLVVALRPEPGATVLELACGPGDTGFAVAEWLRPGGRLLATDGAEAMVKLARERAGALGLDDVVEVREVDAEHIDLPAASVDGVLCRWGYMLLADPGAALRESRRVLRRGGRIALAAWDGAQANPWSSAPMAELVERGAVEPPEPGAPGQFAWADRDAIGRRLEDAGFFDVELQTLAFTFAYPDLDAWWDVQLDLSVGLRDAVAAMTPAERDDLRDAVDARLAPYVDEAGSVRLPASTHVAAADA
jgi:SAM-dependent methyltransferase